MLAKLYRHSTFIRKRIYRDLPYNTDFPLSCKLIKLKLGRERKIERERERDREREGEGERERGGRRGRERVCVLVPFCPQSEDGKKTL